jgi:selenocysteine lyase/cysteine desulfurase
MTPMWSRREFLATLTAAAAALGQKSAAEAASDPVYWRTIQRAFDVDRAIINLNNGNSSPSPRIVQEAVKRYLDYSNRLPVHYRGLLEQRFGDVRAKLASAFGCDTAELAMTRNATESMHIVQNGLDLRPGDEVLTTDQDYTLMLWAWQQRVERDRIRVTRIQFPVPTTGADLVRRFEQAITPRTKVLHFCHMTNVTGQIFPVRELSLMARVRGIVTIVDGAQALAHFPFALRDLECDAYGASLHKWLMAPHGTGLLYVRKDSIRRFWPLHAEWPGLESDIRKFEEVGTQSAAPRAAIPDALAFHHAMGADRKAERLRYLTLRWTDGMRSIDPGVQFLSNLDPGQTWAMTTVGFEKRVDVQALERLLFDRYRIITAAVVSQALPGPIYEFQGLRVTPNVYTTLDEIDRFIDTMRDVMKRGLPRRG